MGKICYSLGEHTLDYCMVMNRFFADDVVELRLDLLNFQEKDLKIYFNEKTGLTAVTYQVNEEDESIAEEETERAAKMLAQAIVLGADYVTIPYDFNQKETEWLLRLAWNHNCKIIVSYHNFYGTPSTKELKSIAEKCYAVGADIVKIVTTAHHPAEAGRVLKLYDYFDCNTLVAFAMGEAGTQSRKDSFAKGAPLMFATTLRDFSTAKGQLTFYDMLPNEEKKDIGTIFAPSSKSLAIRAIIASALSSKKSIIKNVDFCDDIVCAIGVAEQLLADIDVNAKEKTLIIHGHQDIHKYGLKVRNNHIFVGESALLTRLCIPLCGLSNEDITINGYGTLLKRKINDHNGALKKHGLNIIYHNRCFLPVTVKGRLSGGDFRLKGEKGSQTISGLLFTLPFCPGKSTITISRPTSLPYILNTLSVLHDFGFTFYDYNDFEDGFEMSFEGGQQLVGNDFTVETDWSAAALWLVSGVLAGQSGVENLPYDTLQADSLIMDTFDDCGADIGCYNYEDCVENNCYFQANRSVCIPFNADLTHNPDLIGPLLLLALRCEGKSTISGIGRLHGKESDRAATFVEEFRKLGADIIMEEDTIVVSGSFHKKLKGCAVSSHNDHRLALALMVARLISDGVIEIDNTDCICKSWPNFQLEI